MRPLIIDLGRDYRGGQQQALLLLKGLIGRGHEPYLLTVADSGLAKDALNSGIPTKTVSVASRQFRSAGAIRDLIEEHGSEILHANEPHALTASWIARAHRRVPVIASRRVIFPLSRSPISLARYRASAKIVAVSQSVARALMASGIAADHMVVIPDGVTVPEARDIATPETGNVARETLGIPGEVKLIGNVAAFTPDKGQDLLVRALAIVRSTIPNCELLLAGLGPCREQVESLAAAQGLKDAVRFVGHVDDLSKLYQAMDIFAFPAQAEALGTALLLAMSYGLPAVALDRGGVPEAVQDGANGVLIHEKDDSKLPQSLSVAIQRLLSNPAEAHRLGSNARQTIVEKFSVDYMVEATLELYKTMIFHSNMKSARSSADT